jgi:RNA polymerase sigma factor (sigma-70 family)
VGEGLELVENETLLRALQEGRPEASEELQRLVRQVATPVLRERLGAQREGHLEELLQAILESAWCKASVPGWRPHKNLAGFLKGRARGAFSKWAGEKRRKRRNMDGVDDLTGSAPNPADVAERADENRALRDRIRLCSARLDPDLYLPVWRMRYQEELDLAEIARRLGRKYETVAVQVFRANQMMQDCLRAGGFKPWLSP